MKGDANIAIRNEFHRCAPELSSVSPRCRLSRRSKKRTSCFRLPQFPTAFRRFVSEPTELTPDLPRRAVAPAHAICAPLFVGVVGSRFVFCRVSPVEKSINRQSSTSATESDARARPGLPYLLRSSRTSLARAPPSFSLQMNHAQEFLLSVFERSRAIWRHRLRSPSRGFAPLSSSLVFSLPFSRASGKAVTSSNCELAAQSDDGAF